MTLLGLKLPGLLISVYSTLYILGVAGLLNIDSEMKYFQKMKTSDYSDSLTLHSFSD